MPRQRATSPDIEPDRWPVVLWILTVVIAGLGLAALVSGIEGIVARRGTSPQAADEVPAE